MQVTSVEMSKKIQPLMEGVHTILSWYYTYLPWVKEGKEWVLDHTNMRDNPYPEGTEKVPAYTFDAIYKKIPHSIYHDACDANKARGCSADKCFGYSDLMIDKLSNGSHLGYCCLSNFYYPGFTRASNNVTEDLAELLFLAHEQNEKYEQDTFKRIRRKEDV